MTDEQREAFAALAEICELAPDVRLGQLFAHLGFLGECHIGKGLGAIDDDELIAILYRHRTELRARLAGAAGPLTGQTVSATSVSGRPTVIDSPSADTAP
jgi:hypothetical protein